MDARPRPSANRRCIVILRGCGEAEGNAADDLKNQSNGAYDEQIEHREAERDIEK